MSRLPRPYRRSCPALLAASVWFWGQLGSTDTSKLGTVSGAELAEKPGWTRLREGSDFKVSSCNYTAMTQAMVDARRKSDRTITEARRFSPNPGGKDALFEALKDNLERTKDSSVFNQKIRK